MTDEIERLSQALRAATPAPDAAAKAAALRLAMQSFDRLQETAAAARPTAARPAAAGVWTGIARMYASMTSRGALAATASVAALCLGVVVVLPQLDRPDAGRPEVTIAATPPRDAALPAVPAEPAGPAAATAPAAAPAAAPAEAPPGLGATPGTPLGRNDAAAAAALAGGETLVPVAPPVLGALSEADAGAETARRAPQGGRSKQAATPGVLDGLAAAAPLAAPPPAAADLAPAPAPDTEAFANAERHRVTRTAEQPVSTFSIDVDTASYAVVRASLMAGMLPPPEAVRIEEMVNYFPYDYPAPEAGEAPFRPTVTVMPAPWAEGRRLVQIGLQGRMPALADRPPLNLVFLIDTSGSMEDANKLPLLKQSLRLMLPNLRPEDEVAIVAYAGSAGEVLPPTAAGEAAAISAALDRLDAGGATAGAEGLELAYQVAARMAGAGEVTRVLLATDGDFNVGLSDPAGLEAYIARKRASGTYLSVLGFGRGNLDDATMQALAQAGNGTAAYIDTLGEARKVLVDQLTGALFPIADDVKVQVEWNPAEVAEWRLIGYETRGLRREDFNNDRVDAGEIGAGHSVTAIYEITAPDSPALASDPLRYGTAVAAADGSGELGFLRLRYKEPGGGASRLIELPITPAMAPVGDDARFAAAIAGFGQLLTGATHLGDWGWQEAIALALAGRGEDPYGYRNEAVGLMRLAESLSR